MQLLIDIHSHQTEQEAGVLRITNLYHHFELAEQLPCCSLGIHPWYIEPTSLQQQELEQWAQQPSVLAIGECGLDKAIPLPIVDQVPYFMSQVYLANKINKPLIIHCVQAFTETVNLLRAYKVQVPVIFHGYNRKATIAKGLLEEGYYLSFGRTLLKEQGGAIAILKQMPADRFFLETDDDAIDLQQLYERAAEIRETTVNDIISQVQENFQKVFKRV